MATDFFGYNRVTKATNQLSSSEFAILTVGSRVNLCQQTTATYSQEIRPIYEVGAPSVVWVTGHASGTVGFGRLAGSDGFFANLRNTACGQISPVSINSGAGSCFTGSGTLNFSGAVIESVTLTISAGAIEITEAATLRVASMS